MTALAQSEAQSAKGQHRHQVSGIFFGHIKRHAEHTAQNDFARNHAHPQAHHDAREQPAKSGQPIKGADQHFKELVHG